MTDGPYTLDARATDAAGNTADATPVLVQVNNPPTAVIVSPEDGVTLNGTVLVQVEATDSIPETLTVQMTIGGTTVDMVFNEVSGYYEEDWDTALGTDGPQTINVQATDGGGNVTDADPVLVTVDNLAPTVSIVNPVDASFVAGAVIVQVEATDVVDAAGSLAVEMSISDADFSFPINLTYSAVNGTYQFAWDTTGQANGVYTIDAQGKN